jgi:HEAT repeat protein
MVSTRPSPTTAVACMAVWLVLPAAVCAQAPPQPPASGQPAPSAQQIENKPAPQSPEKSPAPAQAPQTPKEKAWNLLREAVRDDSAEKRAHGLNALGLLQGNREAEKLAREGLKDDKANVRVAATAALGSMHAVSARKDLEAALDDKDPGVALSAANSLLLLKDHAGYEAYYAVLTGERRAAKGLIKQHLDTLKDKKKMAEMSFEEGLGFIPYAGIGYSIYKTVSKDDGSPIRAAAAKRLARDPDQGVGDALLVAAGDKNWAVRASALEALALRGDTSYLSQVAPHMDDDKDIVRFTAAACVAHLSDLSSTKKPTAGPAPGTGAASNKSAAAKP